jgi:hypothetical protein
MHGDRIFLAFFHVVASNQISPLFQAKVRQFLKYTILANIDKTHDFI